MNNYEYLEIAFDEGVFWNSITVADNASSLEIHDIFETKEQIKNIKNPAVAIEKLNELGWELISSHTKGQHGYITHYILKRLKST